MDLELAPKFSVFINVGSTNWNPEECTRAVGLQPSQVWRQPDNMVRGGQRRSEWSYGFEKRSFYVLDEALGALLDEVWDYREEIRRFGAQDGFDLAITCTVTISKDRPEYTVSARVLGKLAWFECELGLDVFDYSEDRDDEDDAG